MRVKTLKSGDKFNNWTVIEYFGIKWGKVSHWTCECICGNIREISTYNLKSGKSKSCGCVDLHKRTNPLTPFKKKYGITKIGAEKRGFNFELTLEEYIQLSTQNCYYCNEEPSTKIYAYSRRRKSRGISEDPFVIMASVDRKDSNLGYTLSNCVPSCVMCNRMKTDFTEEAFLDKIFKICKFKGLYYESQSHNRQN